MTNVYAISTSDFILVIFIIIVFIFLSYRFGRAQCLLLSVGRGLRGRSR
jgi:hypothetical protein